MDIAHVKAELARQTIEVPSWAYGNSGTRFRVFGTPGTPRDPWEKIADAAQVNRYVWTDGQPVKETLYTHPEGLSGFTWNITTAPVELLP